MTPEQSNVVQFSDFAAAAKLTTGASQRGAYVRYREERRANREARLAELRTAPDRLTATCKNYRLRLCRREDWNKARRLTEYLRARKDWYDALALAQDYDIADSNKTYAKCEYGELPDLVLRWRVALMNWILTPAPDNAAVAWKRAQIRGGQHRFTSVTPGRIERAIADDVEWLNDHPLRAKKTR